MTSGATALVPPRPAGRRRRQPPRLTFHGSILVMTVAALLVMAVPPARQLYREHVQLRAAEERLDGLRRGNGELEQRLAQLQDPDYLERAAREKLGLVRPGEIGYVVVPGEAPAGNQERPAAEPAWYERLLESIGRLVGSG